MQTSSVDFRGLQRVLRSAFTGSVAALVVMPLLVSACGDTDTVDSAVDVAEPKRISGPSPLANCFGLPGTITDYEAEPHLAVNPRDPRNLIATWQQDRSFGARGSVVSFSRDGGDTWHTVTIPGADTCDSAAQHLAVSDPWLTFDGGGTAYLASLPGRGMVTPDGFEISASVIVNRSTDGGETWSGPSVVVPAIGFNDKETITADPFREGVVYAVWVRISGGECRDRSECTPAIYFSRSTDAAQSWSEPLAVAPPPENVAQNNPRLYVMHDGSLRAFFEHGRFPVETGDSRERRLMMTSSDDSGLTWNTPRELLVQTIQLPSADGSEPFHAVFEEAVASDTAGQDLYVAFTQAESSDARSPSTVWLLHSADGGRECGEPEVVAELPAFAMLPSVSADGAGRLGVTWYDFSSDEPDDGQLTTTYRVALRSRASRTWRLASLGSFDALRCGRFSAPGLPGPKHPWMGEYFGLVPHDQGFATAFVGCGELAERGPADILFGSFR